MDQSLKIAIIDENPLRAEILKEGLREAGHRNVSHISEMANLLGRLKTLDPDVILIDLENPSRDVLEQMLRISRTVKRPIAMFVDQSDAASIEAAIGAGVSAYVVDGLKKERVAHVLDISIIRFKAFSRLQHELDQAKSALEERKLVDRAKAILMRERKLLEQDAYALLRKTAMNENRRIADIAQSVITAADLFK